MNSLLIIAHPNKESFSHKLAQEYNNTKKKNWHDIRMIDLYDDERQQNYLQLDQTNRYLDDPLREKHQKHITRADEIVYLFPIWWFNCPAILQNRFDVNFTPWFAYKYRSGKITPEKLLNNKSVRVIATAGGPTLLYKTLWWLIITLPRYLGKIDYVGMKLSSWTWFANMNAYKTTESRSWMREKIRKLAMK